MTIEDIQEKLYESENTQETTTALKKLNNASKMFLDKIKTCKDDKEIFLVFNEYNDAQSNYVDTRIHDAIKFTLNYIKY